MTKVEFNAILLNKEKYIGRQLLVVYTFFWSRFGEIYKITDKCIFYKYDFYENSYYVGRISLQNCDIADIVPKEHEVDLYVKPWYNNSNEKR